ncbi:phage tail protein [Cronobacter turicensis]|nr:phage tail protein [Cronobacter turicensis]
MSQTAITYAFEQWKAQQAATGADVVLDEFVFANVPGLDTSAPVDRAETLPDASMIVHRQAVTKTGLVNENAVVYSVVLGATTGDFSFNWIGLVNRDSGTLAMIVHAPVQQKIKTAAGQQGNVLTRSFLMEYNGAANETAINTPADTWQIDFTARLDGADERTRVENIDLYGPAAFFGSGYQVTKTGTQYSVSPGVGYVAGLRSELPQKLDITVTTKPVSVWLDVAWRGSLTSVWGVESKVTVAETLANYEQNGVKHYVFAVARIDADGTITDLRPKGSLFLEKSKNLADVQDVSKARESLKLKGAALLDVGSEANTVAAGNDSRIVGAVQRSGDEMTGELKTTAANSFRMKQGGRASFWRFDGTTQYLMFTKLNDADGTYNELRPFSINAATGDIVFGHNIITQGLLTGNGVQSTADLFLTGDNRQHIVFKNKDGTSRAYIYKDRNSDLRINNGVEGGGDFAIRRDGSIGWGTLGGTLHNDGNLNGSAWGGWLSNWLNSNFAAINNNINTRAVASWVQQNFVSDVALGAEGSFIIARNAWQRVPGGCVLTGYNAEGDEPINDTLFYRPIQKYIPAYGWMTVGHTA